jgi:Family of unknown function (DUF6585)
MDDGMNNTDRPPEEFSNVMGLGAPREWFKPRPLSRVLNLVWSFLFLGGAAALLIYGVSDTLTAVRQHGTAVIDDRLVMPLIGALVLFLIGLALAWWSYSNWKKAAVVYERGFALFDRKGLHPWRWEEIVSLTAAVTRHYTNGIYTHTTHAYTLLNRQNEKLVLTDALKNVVGLAALIEQSIFPLLYPREAERYNRGETVSFGPVAINKSGIVIGKKTYGWGEVGQVSVEKGFLKVSKKDGGWFSGTSALVSSIPNLQVLLSILSQVVGVKAG